MLFRSGAPSTVLAPILAPILADFLRGAFMSKAYPMILLLQTKQAAQSSVSHYHIPRGNCGEIAEVPDACPDFIQPLLTMNSVAQGLFPD